MARMKEVNARLRISVLIFRSSRVQIQVSKAQVKGKLDELLAEKTDLEAKLQLLESGSGELNKRRQSIARTFDEELPQKKWIVKL
jgi:cell division protein FtsB